MKASALMAQPEDCDPQRAIETLPPPDGAKDAYSAQTRVGTLPEHVLEAMRQHEPDAALEKRTKSGMLRAAARLLTPPAQPTFTAAAAPTATPTPIVLAPPRASSRLPAPRRTGSGVLRSFVVVALFALLGAVCAAALAFLGY